MILDFYEMLILDMLTVDDEPLNLVLSEAIVNDDSKQYIKPPYNNYKVQLSQIKDALKRLIKFNMIIILDETGEQLDISINERLSQKSWNFADASSLNISSCSYLIGGFKTQIYSKLLPERCQFSITFDTVKTFFG